MQEVVRGKHQKCQICIKKFTLFNVEHICKRCLRSVCKACADRKEPVFEKSGQRKPHRLCAKCVPEFQFIDNYKTSYKLSFNSTCKIGQSWSDQLVKVAFGKSGFTDYTTSKIRKPALKTKTAFWQDLNFSLRNFVGVCTEGIDYYPVLKSLYDKCQISFVSQYVCMFFLCHCNQSKAYQSVMAIYSIIEKQPADIQNVMDNLKYFGCNPKELAALQPFVNSIFENFIYNLSLNIVTSEISLFIISAFIQERGCKALQKGLATCVFILKDFIIKYMENKKAIENEFVQNIRFNQFQTNIKIMAQKQKLLQETIKSRSNITDNTNPRSSYEDPGRTMSMVVPTKQTQPNIIPQTRAQSVTLNFAKPQVETPSKQPDPVPQVPPIAQQPNLKGTDTVNGTGRKQSNQFEQTLDVEDFDEDLRKIYEQNEKLMAQTRALKKLGEQLLKSIDQL